VNTKIKKTNNKIIYSSYSSHHSTTNKIEKSSNSFSNQLFASNRYLELIYEFYNSLKKYQQKTKKNHDNNNDYYINLIIKFTKDYNANYINLMDYDHLFNETKHISLDSEMKKFEFNFNQIGITISNHNLLKVNTYVLKQTILKSIAPLDFIFEKQGLFDHLQNYYSNELLNPSIKHINIKI
jgi:hypothetical protein